MRIAKGEYIDKKDNRGRNKIAYVVYGAKNRDEAIKAVWKYRKVKEELTAWKGFIDNNGLVYRTADIKLMPVWVVIRKPEKR